MIDRNIELFNPSDFVDRDIISIVNERYHLFYSFLHMIDDNLGIRDFDADDGINGEVYELWCQLLKAVDDKLEKATLLQGRNMGSSFLITCEQ